MKITHYKLLALLSLLVIFLIVLWLGIFMPRMIPFSSHEVIQELSRSKSPNGKIDAVIIQTDLHSTVPTLYDVFVVGSNMQLPFEDMESVFHSSHTEDLRVSWTGDRHLKIYYSQADIGHFQNSVTVFIDDKPCDVHITLETP
jgi:hypothetical protein